MSFRVLRRLTFLSVISLVVVVVVPLLESYRPPVRRIATRKPATIRIVRASGEPLRSLFDGLSPIPGQSVGQFRPLVIGGCRHDKGLTAKVGKLFGFSAAAQCTQSQCTACGAALSYYGCDGGCGDGDDNYGFVPGPSSQGFQVFSNSACGACGCDAETCDNGGNCGE